MIIIEIRVYCVLLSSFIRVSIKTPHHYCKINSIKINRHTLTLLILTWYSSVILLKNYLNNFWFLASHITVYMASILWRGLRFSDGWWLRENPRRSEWLVASLAQLMPVPSEGGQPRPSTRGCHYYHHYQQGPQLSSRDHTHADVSVRLACHNLLSPHATLDKDD